MKLLLHLIITYGKSRSLSITLRGMMVFSLMIILLETTAITPSFGGVLQGQEKTVTGTVTSQEDDLGLPGVNILVKGTTIGTVTDANGNYSLGIPDGDITLVYSYLGYESEEIQVNGRTLIDVSLTPDLLTLPELIFVGYGATEKKDLTGSVARVTTEELEAIPVYNVEQALVGRAPGVTVQQNSGEPGGRMEVRIRGGNSMIGSNEPLYVVDGFPITGTIDYLNPSDIESIDILKDASATAIYGSRGANGVVIVTTKRGGKSMEISSYYGVQNEIDRYDVLDARQYAEVANEWAKNEGLDPFYDDLNAIQNPGTDWQDLIFRNGRIQNHTLSFSGGKDDTKYSFSFNYFEQEGLIINTGAQRGSLRLNIDHKINNVIKVGVNTILSRREINRLDVNNGNLGGRIYTDALGAPPTLDGPFDAEGNYYNIPQLPDFSFVSLDIINPLVYQERKDRSLSNAVLANTYVEFNILKGLTFRSMFGLEYAQTINDDFIPIIYDTDLGQASDGYSYRNSFLTENILSYTKKLGDSHDINLVGGFTAQTFMSRSLNATVRGLANNVTENYDLSAGSIIPAPSNGISEWTLYSWLGRANYTFRDKYLFTVSVRSDGSSRFGANNQWATFPSAAIAWRLSEEPFIKSLQFIDDLKVRASYGKTGNTALSPYQSLDRLRSVRVVLGDNTDEVGFVPDALANSNLKWETTTQMDIGMDLTVLQGKLQFSFDYYKKNTDNLLASVPLPPSLGFSSALQNIGEVENRGVEVSLNATVVKNDFRWNITGQVSANRNEVIELAGGSDIFGSANSHPFNATINIAREGEPLGVFYGLIEDGLDEEGFVKHVDINQDGVVNAQDRVILGNPYPDFTYGLNNTFTFKNFDLNIFIQGVEGRDMFWETAGVHLNSFQRGMNQFADLYGNYWTEDNPDPNAKYPRVSSATTQQVSDRYVEDASFIRLKLVKLAYNLPVSKIKWLNRAQIYISGTNLLTITDYPGLDPEVNTTGTDSQNIGARLRVGIDESAYPSAKIYTVGLNLGF